MEKYILVLDIGTTNVKASLIDKNSRIFCSTAAEFPIEYPQDGLAEESGTVIWGTISEMIRKVLTKSGIDHGQIDSIGITNQRETFFVWDKTTGIPVYNGIGWQDRRGMEYSMKLVGEGHLEEVFMKTGLVLFNFMQPGPKLTWLLENVPDVRERAQKGELAFGTVDSWIIWNLTQGKCHVTDVSNASRTCYYNINTLQWDQELLDLFQVPASMLPEVKDSGCFLGNATVIFDRPIPIMGDAGDGHAATFGHRCVQKGMVKASYGTTCVMMANAGHKPVFYPGMVTTIGWKIGDDITYLYESGFYVAGLALKWLRDVMHMADDYETMNMIAENTPVTEGLYVIPTFLGVVNPELVPNAKGMITGLNVTTGPNDLIKATMDSLAFLTKECTEIFEKGLGEKPAVLAVDGGVTASEYIMQLTADVTDVRLVRGGEAEATTIGAAYLAGLASGFWCSMDDIEEHLANEQTAFEPSEKKEEAAKRYAGWVKATQANLGIWRQEESA